METVISTIPVKGRVHDITVSRDGEYAYVALSKSVMVLNSENRVVAGIPLPDRPTHLLVNANGKQLIVSWNGGSVSVVDTDTYTVKILRASVVSDVMVSPDGHYLYAVRRQTPDRGAADLVTAIDIANESTAFNVPVDDVAGLALNPAGTRLYVISYDRRTYYQYPPGRPVPWPMPSPSALVRGQ